MNEEAEFRSTCGFVEDIIETLKKHSDGLRDLVRKKKEARETITRMQYQARCLAEKLDQLKQFLND